MVGQNNTGKTAVSDAVRAVSGDYHQIPAGGFSEDYPQYRNYGKTEITEEDLTRLQKKAWSVPTGITLPGIRIFAGSCPPIRRMDSDLEFVANRQGRIRAHDGYQKNNISIPKLFPRVYYIDAQRKLGFSAGKLCFWCRRMSYRCVLTVCLTGQNLYPLFFLYWLSEAENSSELNAWDGKTSIISFISWIWNDFSRRVNERFRKNGGKEQIFGPWTDIEKMLSLLQRFMMKSRKI